MRAEGKRVSLCHFNYINPLPHGVRRDLLEGFRKIVVCELNEGQFANYLRQQVRRNSATNSTTSARASPSRLQSLDKNSNPY